MELIWDPVIGARLHVFEHLPKSQLMPLDAEQTAISNAWSAPVTGYVAPDVSVEDSTLATDIGPVDARIYRPRTGTPTEGIVWVHGGAFAFGDLISPEADVVSRELCARTGQLVVSVDYRKAQPGQHYPVCHDDVHAAWNWVISNFENLQWSIGGASAGANLVLGAAQRLRDELGLMPSRMALVYPVVHRALPRADAEFLSMLEHVPERLVFSDDLVAAMHNNYAGPEASDLKYAFPGDGDLGGLPNTLILNCEFDSLRLSGEKAAADLHSVGNRVTCVLEHGVPHGHLSFAGLPTALRSLQTMAGFFSGDLEKD